MGRNEFSYAGEWLGLLNEGKGIITQYYGSSMSQNIQKTIEFIPIGHKCSFCRYYNVYSLLGLGCIPQIEANYVLE